MRHHTSERVSLEALQGNIKTGIQKVGRPVRAGRDGQRTLPDERSIQACDWIERLALPRRAGPFGPGWRRSNVGRLEAALPSEVPAGLELHEPRLDHRQRPAPCRTERGV